MLGRHLIKSWSSTEASVSLSSGEAKFYVVVNASGICLGYQSLLRGLRDIFPVRDWTDSTAALGICSQQGLGKLRYMETQHIWIHQSVRDQIIAWVKVLWKTKIPQTFTKHLACRRRIYNLLAMLGCWYATGRAVPARPKAPGRQWDHQERAVELRQTSHILERTSAPGRRVRGGDPSGDPPDSSKLVPTSSQR